MNCDRIARAYRWLEYLSFGRELERRRFRFLAEVRDARRVLLLGDGDGRFLARLVAQNPGMRADSVDSSGRMLGLARSRAGEGGVKYLQGDAREIPLKPCEYDLVVTHFFLDCLERTDMETLLGRIATALQPNAGWLVSEFREPRWAPALLRGLYLFFRVFTGLKTQRLVDHRPIFARHGFQLLREETSRGGLLASELWGFRGGNDSERS